MKTVSACIKFKVLRIEGGPFHQQNKKLEIIDKWEDGIGTKNCEFTPLWKRSCLRFFSIEAFSGWWLVILVASLIPWTRPADEEADMTSVRLWPKPLCHLAAWTAPSTQQQNLAAHTLIGYKINMQREIGVGSGHLRNKKLICRREYWIVSNMI